MKTLKTEKSCRFQTKAEETHASEEIDAIYSRVTCEQETLNPKMQRRKPKNCREKKKERGK